MTWRDGKVYLPQLAVAPEPSTVGTGKNSPLATRGQQTGSQGDIMMGRHVPGLKGAWATSGQAARSWVGTFWGRKEGAGTGAEL